VIYTRSFSKTLSGSRRVGSLAPAQGVANELTYIKMLRPADTGSRSPEIGNLLGPFEDNAGIVFQWSPRGFAIVHNAWVRPIGDADAAVAALLVTHDVAPLAVDIAVTVREGLVARIKPTVVASA